MHLRVSHHCHIHICCAWFRSQSWSSFKPPGCPSACPRWVKTKTCREIPQPKHAQCFAVCYAKCFLAGSSGIFLKALPWQRPALSIAAVGQWKSACARLLWAGHTACPVHFGAGLSKPALLDRQSSGECGGGKQVELGRPMCCASWPPSPCITSIGLHINLCDLWLVPVNSACNLGDTCSLVCCLP
jgi:hypothetical protein